MAASFRVIIVLAALLVPSTSAEDEGSFLEVLNNLNNFRGGALTLFEAAAATLKEAGHKEDADTVATWSYNWLSVLGIHQGLTGLAKDFALSYLGRSSYHDSNGPLIDAIKEVTSNFPTEEDSKNDKASKALRKAVRKMCSEGKKLFQEGGSLHDMLKALDEIMAKDHNSDHLFQALIANPKCKHAFEFLTGPRTSHDDLDDDEEEL